MKRVLIVIMVCFLAASGIFATGQTEAKVDDSLDRVLDKGVFVLGLDDSFPPMGFRDEDNNIVGFDIDLAKEVCLRNGIELKSQPISWDAKEQELNTHQIDCIWNGFTITEDRKVAMSMTDAYLSNAQVVIVKADSPYQTLADLEGKSVGVQVSSTGQAAVEDNPEFKDSLKKVIEFKDFLTALMDLKMGSTDAVVMDLIVANYNITKNRDEYRILEQDLGAEAYGIGFRKDDVALRDAIQNTLMEMVEDGKMAEISEKWFGSDITVLGK